MNIFKKKKTETETNIGKAVPQVETEPKKIVKGIFVHGILKQPHATEKATRMSSEGKYVFLVESKATKPAIRKEVARRYGVRVTNVNIVRKTKRPKRWGYRTQKPPLLKKAIVTLAEGQKLEIA